MSDDSPLPEVSCETGLREDLGRLARQTDRRVVIMVLLAALILTLQRYFAQYALIVEWLRGRVPDSRLEMIGSLCWCGSIVFVFMIVPMVCIKAVFRQPLAAYGWSPAGLRRHWKPYGFAFVAVLPILLLAASTATFQRTYPFFGYARESWQALAVWEIAYGLQFVGVEFFFRGFLLFGLHSRFRAYSILLTVLPYCMVHFTKPLGEVVGAIGAALILGYLALKNRSIWGGAALHWAVAATMDLSAIAFGHGSR